MEKIRNCPFCGGEAILWKGETSYLDTSKQMYAEFAVKCEPCRINTPLIATIITINDDGTINIISDGAKLAIAAWNRREGEQEQNHESTI